VSGHLQDLDRHLAGMPFLAGDEPGFVDAALLPFIRQFSMVDDAWFRDAPYPDLRRWLNEALASELFETVMFKTPPWRPGREPLHVDWD
jgi:glutathione S-transferase